MTALIVGKPISKEIQIMKENPIVLTPLEQTLHKTPLLKALIVLAFCLSIILWCIYIYAKYTYPDISKSIDEAGGGIILSLITIPWILGMGAILRIRAYFEHENLANHKR